ncbi:MAG: AlwI family type II restriction endonuclease [Dehalococcoidia bacterium]|nr:AlwI family type II restriction endonuclease [Dehalococcoidia bacterium]
MPIQWTIGNTTVRNPERLRAGLAILKAEFEGYPWSYESQRKFLERLIEEGLYEAGSAKSPDQKEQHGRTWGSVYNELGLTFAYRSGGNLCITPVGDALLDERSSPDEVYLRQLLKYQLPNPLPGKYGPKYTGVSVLPFLVALKMVKELDGMSKEEMGIFLFSTMNMSEVDGLIEKAKQFRRDRGNQSNREARERFTYNYHIDKLTDLFVHDLEERYQIIEQFHEMGSGNSAFLKSPDAVNLAKQIARTGKGSMTQRAQRFVRESVNAIQRGENPSEIKDMFRYYYIGIKRDTLRDYGDLNFRYLRLSGLFTARGNKMVLSSEKIDLAEHILAQDWAVKPIDRNFLEDWFWNPDEPGLPLDDCGFLRRRAARLQEDQTNLRKSLKTPLPVAEEIKIEKPIEELVLKDLKFMVYQLESQALTLKEVAYYEKLQEPDSVDEIDRYYDQILRGELLGGNKPAHFEWNTWRGFLAIDRLSCFPHETRNFAIDDDLMPTDFALPNKPDMNFTYEDFKLVVEVTLLTGPNQWSAEGEPVPRHVARVQAASSIPTIAVFIAPTINVNTAVEFYSFLKQRPYITDNGSKLYLTIIPFTLDQWRGLLRLFKLTRFAPADFRNMLEDIAGHDIAPSITDGSQWIALFPSVIERWQEGVLSRI